MPQPSDGGRRRGFRLRSVLLLLPRVRVTRRDGVRLPATRERRDKPKGHPFVPASGVESEPSGTEPVSPMTHDPHLTAADGRLALSPEAVAVPFAVDEPAPPPAGDSSLGYTPARVLRALRRRWYAAVPAAVLLATVS